VSSICFFLAAARIWTTEHEARVVVERQLQSLTIPKLSGKIEKVAMAPVGTTGNDTLLTLLTVITNTGAPSIADNFRVDVVWMVSGKTTLTTLLIPPDLSGTVTMYTGGERSPFTKMPLSDYLPEKALRNQIATNGALPGFITCMIAGIKAQELEREVDKVEFRVSFTDARGQLYTISGRPRERSGILILNQPRRPF
jgi:hypothetical protein